MKKFINILIVFFLFFGLMWVVVEIYQKHVLNEYTYKHQYLEQNGDKIKTLLLGNSAFFWSLNPASVGDSCFDAATNARWIYFDRALLEQQINNMPNLKIVMYPLCYAIPFVGIRHHFEWSGALSEHSLSQCYFHYKFMGIKYDKVDKYRWHRTRQEIIGGEKINISTLIDNRNCDEFGWQKHSGNLMNIDNFVDTLTEEVINRPEIHDNYVEFFDELEKMARFCCSHQIRFLVVATPVMDTMKSALCEEAITRINSQILSLSKQTDVNLEFYDYLYDIEFRSDSLYFTCDHLNDVGATKLGERLKRDARL